MMPQAVEEMLRYDPSVPRGWRIAKQDVELGGETIGQGSLVFPILAAANRDPDAFPQPNRFDIQREMNKHVAFGHGIHYCLGAPLARVEGAVAMQSLLQRFPNLHLSTDSLTWKHDVAIRSLESLPVAW
jgi:cytochrome P450